MRITRPAAAIAALALALGGVALTAAPASAHTGGVTGVAECEADGTYTVTWTYTAANVPDGVEAETKAMTASPAPSALAAVDGVLKGGQVFLSVWTEHAVNVPGAPTRVGNWSGVFAQTGIPGTALEATTMVQTDWKGGPSEDPVGKVTLEGTCEPPVEEPPAQPEPLVVATSEKNVDCVVGKWVITGSITTTPYVFNEETGEYELDVANAKTEPVGESFEELTDAEREAYCPVTTPEEPEQPEEPSTPTPTPAAPVVPTTPSPTLPPAAPVADEPSEGLAVTGAAETAAIAGVAGIALLAGLTALAVRGSMSRTRIRRASR